MSTPVSRDEAASRPTTSPIGKALRISAHEDPPSTERKRPSKPPTNNVLSSANAGDVARPLKCGRRKWGRSAWGWVVSPPSYFVHERPSSDDLNTASRHVVAKSTRVRLPSSEDAREVTWHPSEAGAADRCAVSRASDGSATAGGADEKLRVCGAAIRGLETGDSCRGYLRDLLPLRRVTRCMNGARSCAGDDRVTGDGRSGYLERSGNKRPATTGVACPVELPVGGAGQDAPVSLERRGDRPRT